MSHRIVQKQQSLCDDAGLQCCTVCITYTLSAPKILLRVHAFFFRQLLDYCSVAGFAIAFRDSSLRHPGTASPDSLCASEYCDSSLGHPNTASPACCCFRPSVAPQTRGGDEVYIISPKNTSRWDTYAVNSTPIKIYIYL